MCVGKVFHSSHYAGDDLSLRFESGEYWKKVFGPIFVYVNSDASARAKPSILWDDAKQRVIYLLTFTDKNITVSFV